MKYNEQNQLSFWGVLLDEMLERTHLITTKIK